MSADKNEKVANLHGYTTLFRRAIYVAGVIFAATVTAIPIVLFLI